MTITTYDQQANDILYLNNLLSSGNLRLPTTDKRQNNLFSRTQSNLTLIKGERND